MAIEVKVAAFEGGQLRELDPDRKGRETVLALPLSRLLMKVVRVPADADAVEFSTSLLEAINPFPDDKLTVSCETVAESEEGKVVIAAALPESAADDIGEALDAAKLNAVRIDSIVLGQIRGVWNSLGDAKGRRLLAFVSSDCISLVILDNGQPLEIRAITGDADLKREIMLSLLEAEDFGGPGSLEEIVVVETEASAEEVERPSLDKESLTAFGPVRTVTIGADAALVGVLERSEEAGALNALPLSWKDVLDETRFKAKMVKSLAIAGGIWALVMATFFGVPIGYGFMIDHQKSLSKQHERQYKAVKEMKAKVDLIHKYSDHDRGALEIMKAVSDRLPEGITLSSWDFKRDDGVRVKGDAESAEEVYAFKDAIDAMVAGEGDDAEPIFGSVTLTGPNASKGKYTFNLDCQYKKEDAE